MESYTILFVGEAALTNRFADISRNPQFKVIYFNTGEDALTALAHSEADLIILLHALPQLDALKTLRNINRLPNSAPVIIAAEAPSTGLVISAFRNGVVDFLQLPIDTQGLLARIKQHTKFTQPNQDTHSKAQFSIFHFLKQRTKLLYQAARKLKNENANSNPFQSAQDRKIEESGPPVAAGLSPPIDIATLTGDEIPRKLENGLPSSPEIPSLQVFFLGKFRVVLNQKALDHWSNRKAKKLFAYLIYHHKKRFPKDVLMDRFWPDATASSARNCLYVGIHGIRQLLQRIIPGMDLLLHKDDCYFLNPEIDLWIDVEAFRQHWRVAQSIEQKNGMEAAMAEYEKAKSVYEGDFLEEEHYESWPDLERENLREIYLLILDKLSEYHSACERYALAIKLCKNILEKDNCREDIHRRLMNCYYKTGRRSRAIKQFKKCVEILERELEIEPSPITIQNYERIRNNFKKSE